MTNARTRLKLELHRESVHKKDWFYSEPLDGLQCCLKKKKLKGKYALEGRLTSQTPMIGESLSAEAHVQDEPSKQKQKKPVWISQFRVSATDYNVLISVIVRGAKWVSSG